MDGLPTSAMGQSIRIRMYRIGFGDCFLVTFPGPHHVLVDCGVHNRGDVGTFDRILDDVERETELRLALLIATHAHEDHIAGFLRASDRFRRFAIREVWLPWSENRSDPLAQRLRARITGLRAALELHFAARGGTQDVLDILANTSAARTEPAMSNLRDGLGTGAKVEFLEAGQIREAPGRIRGLTAVVLGPPRGEAFLRKMEPPKAERYLRATEDGPAELVGDLHPFGNPPEPNGGPRLTEAQRRALVKAVELSPAALAFALDRVVNNTSIVALLRYRGQALLFPGDSQYGGWESWFEGSGELLKSVTFYKVSHHGSENATPKRALEGMEKGRVSAMVSTQNVPWPSIPDPPLMDALAAQTGSAAVRSDSIPIAGAPESPEPAQLPEGFARGPFWIDRTIQLSAPGCVESPTATARAAGDGERGDGKRSKTDTSRLTTVG